MRAPLTLSPLALGMRTIDRSRLTAWADHPVTTETLIRAAHITQLRCVIDAHRRNMSLPSIAWTDDPVEPGVTRIRACHFLEIRRAIREVWQTGGLGQLPSWSGGSAPSAERVILASDVNDLRRWITTYELSEGPIEWFGCEYQTVRRLKLGNRAISPDLNVALRGPLPRPVLPGKPSVLGSATMPFPDATSSQSSRARCQRSS